MATLTTERATMFKQLIGSRTLLASVTCLILTAFAPAQQPGAAPPAYSPYLNLTRPGNVANNYYGLVRPEIQFRNSLQGLQTQYGNLNQAITEGTQSGPGGFRPTGHSTAFMNFGHYYSLKGRSLQPAGTSGTGASGGGPPPRR